ncbi:heme exporter protein CcmD [Pseudomaricurvus sp. HS19]|uniref:heme exporter protein CcmD n=1 Tax=Pseudomaricurvus sp. HS19 TaxID=2692626 RepID=UPI00136F1E34|nr:heme exporter protein CcmD [Pseudomaricurvus sp. HS19]MYM62086.1 heme exporter protein CcmD [Pseudomaricurvus sp. HS19]
MLQFESLSELWNMAGHGPYVWACYLITAIAIVYLLVSPLRRRRQLFEQLRRQARIEAAGQSDARRPDF